MTVHQGPCLVCRVTYLMLTFQASKWFCHSQEGKKHKTQPDHCTHFPSASDFESHARPKTHVLKISPLLNTPRQPRECRLHHTPLA